MKGRNNVARQRWVPWNQHSRSGENGNPRSGWNQNSRSEYYRYSRSGKSIDNADVWISFVDGDDKTNRQGVATKHEMSGNWYEWNVPGKEQQYPELSEDVTMNGTTTYNLDLNKSRVNYNKLEREESAFKNNVLGTSREGIEIELDGMNNPTISSIIIADENGVSLLDDIEGYADDGRASEAWRQVKSWRKLMNCDQASTQPLGKRVNIFEVAVELLIGERRSVEHSSQKAVEFYGGKDAFKL